MCNAVPAKITPERLCDGWNRSPGGAGLGSTKCQRPAVEVIKGSAACEIHLDELRISEAALTANRTALNTTNAAMPAPSATSAAVTKSGAFDIQVCVPVDWSDKQVEDFANRALQSGTEDGWQIRRTGDPALLGAPERVSCTKHEDHVHIMLDA